MDAGCDHASAFALVVEGHGIGETFGQLVDARLRTAGSDWCVVSNWGWPPGNAGTISATGTVVTGGAGGWRRSVFLAQRVGGMWGTPTLMRGCWQSARYRWPVEQLDDEDLHTEEILPTVRVHHCGPLGRLGAAEQQRAAVVVAVADGLLISNGGRLALTDRARLLADALVRTLLG